MTISEMIHRADWTSAELSIEPLNFREIVFLAADEESSERLSRYQAQFADEGLTPVLISHATEIASLLTPNTIVVHIPHVAREKSGVYEAVTKSCTSLIEAAQVLYCYTQDSRERTSRLFWLISRDSGTDGLEYAPLYGLARVMKTEMSESFGGLFDED
ncbi:hypothetical protein BDV24DRAFT_161147 [Aspergillus arachidicola]|uniref:Uncharacterized protein n=1 Tax=Aspergillus arachidicola TaxID=656916 RepID=A0A5N6YEE7_9EURO|nr:hypothetical protein BDV24DRAFT_161147 [Aspergillus arachidicola]